MQHFPINYLALLVAAIVRLFIGAIWYSPLLLGKRWQALVQCTLEEMMARLPKALLGDLISSYIMAFVLVHAVYYAGANSVGLGAAVGFFNWLGFIAVTTFMAVLTRRGPSHYFSSTTDSSCSHCWQWGRLSPFGSRWPARSLLLLTTM